MGLPGRASAAARDLWSDGKGPILLAISLGQLSALGSRLVFPALLPGIKAAFAIDNTAAGAVLGGMGIAFATGQLPGGVLADRIGERNVLAGATAAAGIALAAIVLAPSFPALVAGMLAFGLATGLFGTPRVTVLSNVFGDRGATAIGINTAAGNVGTATMPALAAVLAGAFTWRAGAAIGLPLFAVTAASLWIAVPRRVSTGGAGVSPRGTARAVGSALSRRPVLLSTAGMSCMAVIYQGFTSFFPTYLVATKGLSEPTAATLLGAFFAGGIVLQPAVGNVADRYGYRPTMIAIAGTTAAATGVLPLLGTRGSIAAAAVVGSVQLAFWPVVFEYAIAALPEAVQGSVFGSLRTAFLYVGATGPVIVGALADAGHFDGAFLLLAGVAVAGATACAALPSAG